MVWVCPIQTRRPGQQTKADVTREAKRLIEIYNTQWCHHLNADDVKALVEENRLWDFTRTPRTAKQKETVQQELASGRNGWLPENNGYVPTPEEVNEWSLGGFGHDSINQWICVKAECVRLGVPSICAECNGSGNLPNPRLAKGISCGKPRQKGRLLPPCFTPWRFCVTGAQRMPLLLAVTKHLLKHGTKC